VNRFKTICILAGLLSPVLSFAQNDHSLGFWHLRNVSGEVDLKGQYRQLKSSFNDINGGLIAQAYRGSNSTSVNSNVRILLGTDNPGLCCTSIDEEYNRLAASFERRKKIEKIKYPQHLAVNYLNWPDIEKQVRETTRDLAVVAWISL